MITTAKLQYALISVTIIFIYTLYFILYFIFYIYVKAHTSHYSFVKVAPALTKIMLLSQNQNNFPVCK